MMQVERDLRPRALPWRHACCVQTMHPLVQRTRIPSDADSLSDKHPMHYDLLAPRVRHKTTSNEPNE